MSGVKSGVLCHSSSVLLRARGALESQSHLGSCRQNAKKRDFLKN